MQNQPPVWKCSICGCTSGKVQERCPNQHMEKHYVGSTGKIHTGGLQPPDWYYEPLRKKLNGGLFTHCGLVLHTPIKRTTHAVTCKACIRTLAYQDERGHRTKTNHT